MSLSHVVDILQTAAILLIAIILHEVAHGWTALKLGDPTAKNAGRLTLNPLKHMDPVGSVLLPGLLILLRMTGHNVFIFGWAKPVPVGYHRLRHPKRDMALVALAGPVTNIIIASFFAGLLALDWSFLDVHFLQLAILVNLFLAVFNMVPIPPLDGSRLVMGVLPNKLAAAYARLEPYGILFVMALLWSGALDQYLIPAVFTIARWLGVG